MTKLILETISPIHIGNGNKYSSAEFLARGNKIHRMDINKIYKLLNTNDKEEFVNCLEDQYFRLDNFLDGKRVSIPESKLYSMEKGRNKPREIKEHIKTGTLGYIPGSSLKGAIKTTVLYAFICDDKRKIERIGKIFNSRNTKKINEDIQKFVEDIFSSGEEQSSYSDFMRFIQISDFIPVSDLYVSEVLSLEVNNKTEGWYWYKRNNKIVQSFLETIRTGERLQGEIQFTYCDYMHSSLVNGNEEILNLEEIKRFIYNFSARLINYEIGFANKYRIDFLLDFYQNLKKKNTESSPVIKIGHGAGYLGTTIGMEIKKQDKDIFEKVRESIRGRSYEFEYPKTRRIAVEENVPLGWCKII